MANDPRTRAHLDQLVSSLERFEYRARLLEKPEMAKRIKTLRAELTSKPPTVGDRAVLSVFFELSRIIEDALEAATPIEKRPYIEFATRFIFASWYAEKKGRWPPEIVKARRHFGTEGKRRQKQPLSKGRRQQRPGLAPREETAGAAAIAWGEEIGRKHWQRRPHQTEAMWADNARKFGVQALNMAEAAGFTFPKLRPHKSLRMPTSD